MPIRKTTVVIESQRKKACDNFSMKTTFSSNLITFNNSQTYNLSFHPFYNVTNMVLLSYLF